MVYEITLRVEAFETLTLDEIMDNVKDGNYVVRRYGWVEPRTLMMEYVEGKILDFGPYEDKLSSGQRIEKEAWKKIYERIEEMP